MARVPTRSKRTGAAKAPSIKARKTGVASQGRPTKAAKATKPVAKDSKGRAATKMTRRGRATKVMGFTVPETLTSAINTLINSPRGREILGSAIVAAASAAAASLVKSDSPQVAKAREAIAETGDQVSSAAKDLTDVAASGLAEIVTGTARAILPSSITGEEKKKG